jgi:hypothetical protein
VHVLLRSAELLLLAVSALKKDVEDGILLTDQVNCRTTATFIAPGVDLKTRCFPMAVVALTGSARATLLSLQA